MNDLISKIDDAILLAKKPKKMVKPSESAEKIKLVKKI